MDSMDPLGTRLHNDSADLFFPNDHQQHDMDSAADQAQHQETEGVPSSNSLSMNSPFLNGAGGSNMGMAGVMAALQSLGSNTRAPNISEDDQAAAEDPASAQGQGQFREQIMLEQFKLAQLKQLQELQQQIFQQQMALINGGSSNSLEAQPRDQSQRGYHGLPTPGSSTELRPSHPISVEFVSPMLLNYNDMDPNGSMSLDINSASHTPVFPPHDPSGLDIDMGSFAALTPLSATSTTNPHSHFNAGENNFSSSFDTTNPTGTGSARAQEHFFAHRGTASAPAHIAFGNPYPNHHHSSHHHGMNMNGGMNPMTEPSSPLHSDLDFDISPLTSPWLGAKMTGSNAGGAGSNGRVQAYGHHQYHHQNTNHPHAAVQAGTKRAASPSSADIDVDVVFGGASNSGEGEARSRKRQASISQSPNTMRPSISPAIKPTNANSNSSSSRSSRGTGSGSRSMNSTPLMRGTNASSRTRRGSVAMNSPLAMAIGGSGGNYPGMASPLVGSGSNSSSSTIRALSRNGRNTDGNNNNSNIGFGVVGDSPSPVDLSLSMPPPAAPASAFGNGAGTEAPESLIPVTPASIMNLGGSFVGLGGGLGNNSQAQQAQIQQNSNSGSNTNGRNGSAASTSTSAPAAKTTTKGTGKGANKNDKEAAPAGPATGTRKSGRRAAGSSTSDSNTGLKHILPAGGNSSSSNPSSTSPNSLRASTSGTSAASSSTNTIVPLKERKTSHKAAEQKRRDSLKTTFDDLRGLLPPIPLPNDTDSKSGAAAVDDGTGIGFIALAKASLLPGALPPRGPPKAGGEGPNKGVSKLQLLICGNEYIRVLKGRVERRDEEVERLRREVRRLRARLGGGMDEGEDGNENGFEGEAGAFDDMLDLDRDLDAVEVLESMKASALGASASMNGGGMLAGVDEDIEED